MAHKSEYKESWIDNYIIIFIFILIFLGFWFIKGHAHASFIPDTPQKVDLLANAIYHSEGGKRAKYGIKSIPCKNLRECRRYCKNTIRNNVKRWNNAGRKTDYLTFLRNKYAPSNVSNDPTNLNRHWLKNVRFYINNPKKIQ